MAPEEIGDIRYAGFIDRAAAAVLDLIIVGTLFYYLLQGVVIIGTFIGPFLFAGTARSISSAPEMPAILGCVLAGSVLLVLLTWIYSAGVTSSPYQATFGKMVMGMKVTDTDGRPLTFSQASLRYGAKILSTLILGIGLSLILFSGRRQGLHDRIAGTLVVYQPRPAKVPAEAGPTIIAATARKQEDHEDESRSSIKLVILLICLPILLITLLLALAIVFLAAAGPALVTHTHVVAVTAQQPDASRILVTYQGGQDSEQLAALDVKINGQGPFHWAEPFVGEQRKFAVGTPGRDTVVVIGSFLDGTNQTILDTMV